MRAPLAARRSPLAARRSLFVALSLAACSDPFVQGVDYDCSPARNIGCDDGYTCIDNWCVQLCTASDECPVIEACIDSVCTEYNEPCEPTGDDCLSGWFCSVDVCRKLLDLGLPCADAGDCLSSRCVDGVCCDSSCDGRCESCAAVDTGAADGSCRMIPDGDDPADECTAGSCSAQSECVVDTGAACSSAGECRSGQCSDGVCCDTPCDGVCASCLAANTGSPDGTCDSVTAGNDPDGECGIGLCDGAGACIAGLGLSCSAPGDCDSGFCVDGVCCDGACDSTCEACVQSLHGDVVGDGFCTAMVALADPEAECSNGYGCDGTGLCSASKTWTSAQRLWPAGEGWGVPRITVNAAGYAIASWYEEDTPEDNTAVKLYDPVAGWGPIVDVSQDNPGGSGRPLIDDFGNGLVIWSDGGSVWAARYLAATGWVAPMIIGSGAPDPTSLDGAAMNSDGHAIVAYQVRKGPGNYEIHAIAFSPALGWGTSELLGNVDSPTSGYACIDSGGNAMVVWRESGDGWSRVHEPGTWQPKQYTGATSSGPCLPDPLGGFTVSLDRVYNYQNPADGWVEQANPSESFQIACAPDGYCVGLSATNFYERISGLWAAPSPHALPYDSIGDIRLDDAGNLFVPGADFTDLYQAHVTRHVRGVGWEPTVSFGGGAPDFFADGPAGLALDGQRNAFLVFSQSDIALGYSYAWYALLR